MFLPCVGEDTPGVAVDNTFCSGVDGTGGITGTLEGVETGEVTGVEEIGDLQKAKNASCALDRGGGGGKSGSCMGGGSGRGGRDCKVEFGIGLLFININKKRGECVGGKELDGVILTSAK
jgi:hypothetical protein